MSDQRRDLLSRMRYRNIQIVIGDGSRGFPEAAPYNAILVSAAAPELPRDLVAQLAEGGRMIVPVGPMTRSNFSSSKCETARPTLSARALPFRASHRGKSILTICDVTN